MAAFAGALALACPAVAAPQEFKVGAIGSLSGGGTAWGLALQRGVQMAIDEVEKAGGLQVDGQAYSPRLVMVDDTYTAAGGRTAAQRLISLEKVKYILGPIGSPPALGAVSVTNAAHVLLLSNGYSDAILKNAEHAAYNFRVLDSSNEFGRGMIAWLRQTRPDARKVVLISPNDATGQTILPTVAKLYEEAGIAASSETFDRGMQEFTPLLTRILATKPDIIDLCANTPGDSGLILKQARQLGYKGLIWKVGGPGTAEILNVAGPLAEGFVAYEQFDFTSPQGRIFSDAYHARWPGVINAETPIWYYAAKLLFEALRRAGTVSDVDRIRDAVTKLDGYDPGLIGPVLWGGLADYGVKHQLLQPFVISEIENGRIVTRATLQPVDR